MDYSDFFVRAARICWREKHLWVLSFLAVLGATIIDAARAKLSSMYSGQDGGLLAWLSRPGGLPGRPLPSLDAIGGWLIWGNLALFAFAALVWLLATWAEAALITSVLNLESGQRTANGAALERGWRLLPRFLAIDAIVFLPIFLLLLLLMLAAIALLVSIVLSLVNGASVSFAPASLVAGAFCLTPLICLFFPFSLMTTTFRTLAFRDAAMRPVGVRQNIRGIIRRTWGVIRAHKGNVLICLALLWGVRYLFGTVVSLVNVALLAAAGGVSLSATAGETDLNVLLNLALKIIPYIWIPVAAVGRSILYTFTTAAWTIVYVQISGDPITTLEPAAPG